MNTVKKVLVAMGLSFAAHGVAQAAGPIIPAWNYTLTSVWTSAIFTNGPAIIPEVNAPPNTSTDPLLLSWGVPAPPNTTQSSLGITNSPANSIVNTFIGGGTAPPAFIAPGTNLTHTNRPIFAPSLTEATLQASLTLTNPNPPPAGPGSLPTLIFNIAFTETLNVPPCAATSLPGNPCNDIFVLTNNPFQNQSFVLDGNTYSVNIFPTTANVLSVLENSACAATGRPNGCVGFTTPENATTDLPFGFTVSTEPLSPPVPEPGSLALMGLALMGLAASRKRKNV